MRSSSAGVTHDVLAEREEAAAPADDMAVCTSSSTRFDVLAAAPRLGLTTVASGRSGGRWGGLAVKKPFLSPWFVSGVGAVVVAVVAAAAVW